MTVSPTEVRKATKACRKALKEGEEYLAKREQGLAFGAFEQAQHFAFEAKSLVVHGGKFEESR